MGHRSILILDVLVHEAAGCDPCQLVWQVNEILHAPRVSGRVIFEFTRKNLSHLPRKVAGVGSVIAVF